MCVLVQVLKLPRSGGVVVRSRELRQEARKVRVEEYFYGNRKVRGHPLPPSLVINHTAAASAMLPACPQ